HFEVAAVAELTPRLAECSPQFHSERIEPLGSIHADDENAFVSLSLDDAHGPASYSLAHEAARDHRWGRSHRHRAAPPLARTLPPATARRARAGRPGGVGRGIPPRRRGRPGTGRSSARRR